MQLVAVEYHRITIHHIETKGVVAKEIGTETLEITTAIITTVTAIETGKEIEKETEKEISRAVDVDRAAANSRSLLPQATIETEIRRNQVPQKSSKTHQLNNHHNT